MFELQHFDNGTRLLTAPQADAQSTCVMVMYAVGSRYEDDATGGISHFAEHLFFKGTERRPTARVIATEIDGIGAEFNAFTGKEYTGYYVKCAKEHVPVAIDVLGDMLLHSLFDAEEIEREKGVIVEEMNMYLDTPTSYLPGVYDRLCYGDTPLGRDIIGTPETVRAATRETFTRHLARWYVPSRTVIGLGGAVTDSARAAVEALFGTLPAARERRRPSRGRRSRIRACASTTRNRTRSTSASAATDCRCCTPTATPPRCSRPCSAAACRRASSPRCASAAVSPITSARSTGSTSRPARSSRRPASTSSAPTRPSRRS